MARNRALLTVLCVALVLLAGCSGLGGDGTTTPVGDGTDGTVTSNGTETTATTADGAGGTVALDDAPPGISEDGIENVSALLDAHAAAVEAEGADTVTNVSVSAPSSSLTSNATVRIGADGTITTRTTNDVGAVTAEAYQYTNGSMSAVRQVAPSGERTSAFTAGCYVRQQASVEAFAGYLASGDFAPTSVDDGLVTLTADGIDEDAGEEGLTGNVTAYDATVVVDDEGRVRSFEATVSSVSQGAESTIEIDYEMTEVGVDTVERPSWAADAFADAEIARLSYERVDGAVAITNEGETAIPAGSSIAVASAEGLGPNADQYVVQTSEPIEPGETAYVYRTSADAAQGSVSVGERPDADTAPVEGDLQIVVQNENGIVDAETLSDDEE